MKRSVDLVVATLLLVVTSPLLVVISILISADSSGPVLFLQWRTGRYGKPFRIIKFRTMVPNASSVGSYFTTRDDPRITRVGRLLRKSSLDELPQLLNVVLGHMSLVGPRPDVLEQRASYTKEEWDLRHTVRPGITGLAQATVRSDARPGERKALDLEYVRRASPMLDLKILVMTIRQVLSRGGV